jgi:hypothetical protein
LQRRIQTRFGGHDNFCVVGDEIRGVIRVGIGMVGGCGDGCDFDLNQRLFIHPDE